MTAEKVHSETPQYSEEVGAVKSGAKMMTMGSTDTGYRSTERRKRTKSETAASIGEAGPTSGEWSYRSEHRQSSAFANGGYMRYANSEERTSFVTILKKKKAVRL